MKHGIDLKIGTRVRIVYSKEPQIIGLVGEIVRIANGANPGYLEYSVKYNYGESVFHGWFFRYELEAVKMPASHMQNGTRVKILQSKNHVHSGKTGIVDRIGALEMVIVKFDTPTNNVAECSFDEHELEVIE